MQSYHSALAQDPGQLVAWQGLASFYEKHSSKMGEEGKAERERDLVRVYQKLEELTPDQDKAFEVDNK